MKAYLGTASLLLALAAFAAPAAAQGSFVNWESPHVHPLELTPDHTRLLVVNTPDTRLEVFDVTGATPVLVAEIPVGLDPVSVRARNNGEAWVVNHVSDSVSVIDLATNRVRLTLHTEDEPTDVVFAGSNRAFVSCSAVNRVEVYDLTNLSLAAQRITIEGEDPRALAVSPDGNTVYVEIFESGNRTTVLGGGHPGHSYPPQVVNTAAGPWGGMNPPPNNAGLLNPPVKPGLPTPPRVALIIRQGTDGQWKDDGGGNWTSLVSGANAPLSGRLPGWDLVDHDVAAIDATTLSVSYVTHLMNLCMGLAVNPANGQLLVVGTDAINDVRYIENLKGKFVKDYVAIADPVANTSVRADLNPHLDYTSATLPIETRMLSVGDPRAVVVNADGSKAWVAGLGSNNVIRIDPQTGARLDPAPLDVGEGPTGLALDETNQRLFVLNRFEATVSVVSTEGNVETARVNFFNPEPDAVKDGRRYLYDTHIGSGTGHLACASCHPDARMDRLAWDLGDPQGDMKPVAGNNLKGNMPSMSNAVFEDFHPMKGPTVTQSLQDIIGHEPFHWRGDMAGLEAFAGAFMNLQGTDQPLDDDDMAEMKAYLGTINFAPNPFRNIDDSLPTDMPLEGHYTTGRFGPPGQPLPDGNALHGLQLFSPPNFLAGNNACITCHANPLASGTDMTWNTLTHQLQPIPLGPNGEHHLMLVASDGFTNKSVKVPSLRNAYERNGFNTTLLHNTAGFGFEHDGSADSCERHIAQPPFDVASDQDVADILAFILCLSSSNDLPMGSITDANMPPGTPGQGTRTAVGKQITFAGPNPPQSDLDLLTQLQAMVDVGRLGLVAHATLGGLQRGFVMSGPDRFDSDRLGEVYSTSDLLALAAPGSEVTFTVVPFGTETRIGVDRDLDGYLDTDELDAGSDPTDASSIPTQWTNLGSALTGLHGTPQILGKGPLVANGTISFGFAHMLENAPMILIMGLSEISLPFKGGTLVPAPDVLVVGLSTNGFGTLELAGTLPAFVPSGLTLVLQGWVVDPAGPQGFSATDGITATAP
jgi:YVTN family beta-propeller protein